MLRGQDLVCRVLGLVLQSVSSRSMLRSSFEKNVRERKRSRHVVGVIVVGRQPRRLLRLASRCCLMYPSMQRCVVVALGVVLAARGPRHRSRDLGRRISRRRASGNQIGSSMVRRLPLRPLVLSVGRVCLGCLCGFCGSVCGLFRHRLLNIRLLLRLCPSAHRSLRLLVRPRVLVLLAKSVELVCDSSAVLSSGFRRRLVVGWQSPAVRV